MFTRKEMGWTKAQADKVLKAYEMLKEQADYFDMEVDMEAGTLMPKVKARYIYWNQNVDDPELDRFDIHD